MSSPPRGVERMAGAPCPRQSDYEVGRDAGDAETAPKSPFPPLGGRERVGVRWEPRFIWRIVDAPCDRREQARAGRGADAMGWGKAPCKRAENRANHRFGAEI